jgi:hypothetical protein
MADLHTLQNHYPLGHFQACCVSNSHSLATAFNSGHSSAPHARVITVRRISRNWSHSAMSVSMSKLFYDWGFAAYQFILVSSHLRLTTRNFFQLNPYGYSRYVTSSLTRRCVCFVCICLAFCQVYVSHIQHVIENFSFALYTSKSLQSV